MDELGAFDWLFFSIYLSELLRLRSIVNSIETWGRKEQAMDMLNVLMLRTIPNGNSWWC